MPNDTEGLILTLFAVLMIIIFGGSIYAFFYAIFQFVFSKGEADKIKKAWNTIRFVILGIIFTTFLLIFFPLLFKKLEIPGYKQYTAQNIFKHTTKIMKSIINMGKEGNDIFSPGLTDPVPTPSSSSDFKL